MNPDDTESVPPLRTAGTEACRYMENTVTLSAPARYFAGARDRTRTCTPYGNGF